MCQFYGEVLFSIATSQLQEGILWAGTNDGQIWYTKDRGANWTNVTKNIGGMPAWGTVTSIEPSHFDPGTAYVSVDFHLIDNRDPSIYKTTNSGRTWPPIVGGLPKHPLAYVRIIAEDPHVKGLLFAGTGNGIHYSLDDGTHWTALTAELPHAPVTWAIVQKQFHDLVISTYGRGLYILDDITPLEQLAQKSSDAPVRLFEPRGALALFPGGRALIGYLLKSAPKEVPRIEIFDSHDALIRKLDGPRRVGMNRAEWDLRYEAPKLVALRNAPTENINIWEEPRFRGAYIRPVLHWGIKEAEVGPTALAGKYTIRLTINGQTYTQPLMIVKDPKNSTSDADLEASFKLQLRIRDDITKTAESVNRIEWMRKQIAIIQGMLRSEGEQRPSSNADEAGKDQQDVDKDKSNPNAELLKSLKAMDQKMQNVEYKFISRAEALSDDKYYSAADKIYLNLIWLNAEVGTGGGDVAGGVGFGPTDTSLAVLQMIEKDLGAAETDYRTVMERDVPDFNRVLADHHITPITAPNPSAVQAEGKP